MGIPVYMVDYVDESQYDKSSFPRIKGMKLDLFKYNRQECGFSVGDDKKFCVDFYVLAYHKDVINSPEDILCELRYSRISEPSKINSIPIDIMKNFLKFVGYYDEGYVDKWSIIGDKVYFVGLWTSNYDMNWHELNNVRGTHYSIDNGVISDIYSTILYNFMTQIDFLLGVTLYFDNSKIRGYKNAMSLVSHLKKIDKYVKESKCSVPAPILSSRMFEQQPIKSQIKDCCESIEICQKRISDIDSEISAKIIGVKQHIENLKRFNISIPSNFSC